MVLKFLRSLVSKDQLPSSTTPRKAPDVIEVAGAQLVLHPYLKTDEGGFPRLDWEAIGKWVESVDPRLRAEAWGQAEIAWLLHVRDSLNGDYRLDIQDCALLLSSLEANVARSALDFMTRSLKRISAVLDGVACAPEWGHDILIVFDNDETYYGYVSHFYADDGEFAGSGGMFVNDGCSHFVTMKSDLRVVEPTIVHEMTHSCLSHLPIPA